MADTTSHEDDRFWEVLEPIIFSQDHQKAAPRETALLTALLDLPPGAHVLDLCCGPGRHALALARRGFAVTGVDRVASFIARASDAAKAEGLSAEFVHTDARDFVRPETFDAAISMYNSFGYSEDPDDDRRILGNACRSLRPGGRLLMEMRTREVIAHVCRERTWQEYEGGYLLCASRLVDNWTAVEHRWIIVRGGERKEFRFRHRLYSVVEMIALLTDCGFRCVQTFGDLTGAPFDHEATRLIAVAAK